MKKPLVITLLTGAILALAGPAIGAPPHSSVTGAGTIVDNSGDGTVHITVSARIPAGADNSEGRGNVTIKFPGEPAVHGTVDCLDVGAGSAGLTGELDNGLFFDIVIVDGEQIGGPDRAELLEISDTRLSCQARRPGSEVIKGDFRIRD